MIYCRYFRESKNHWNIEDESMVKFGEKPGKGVSTNMHFCILLLFDGVAKGRCCFFKPMINIETSVTKDTIMICFREMN